MAGTIRVLQVLGTTNRGGAESRIMDLYRHMNREDIQFDFLVHTEKKGYFDDEIKSLGGRIYHLPAFRVYNYFSYRKACKEFFTAHGEFAAVHGHMTSTASIYLPIAKKLGVPLTIAHARSAGVDQGVKGWMTRLLRRRLYRKADVLIACSDLAAEAVFGKSTVQQGQVLILPNAVDTGEFAYNARVREEMRQKLNITDKFVVGHVGRFHYAKNHEFLIDIFQEIKKQRQDALLLLAGDGSLQEMIKKKVDLLGLSESVIFAGAVSPISPWYQAMDCFLFPSRFEGMPGSVVEAQAAGLPCLISDAITRQVKATDLVEFVSLAQSPKEWADKLLTMSSRPRSRMAEEMRNSDYDVNQQVERYRNLYRRKEVN
jgi:glycosyltransferase involved in cell wall biosynthesis